MVIRLRMLWWKLFGQPNIPPLHYITRKIITKAHLDNLVPRYYKWAYAYLQGFTIEEIAAHNYVTRERVRQCFWKIWWEHTLPRKGNLKMMQKRQCFIHNTSFDSFCPECIKNINNYEVIFKDQNNYYEDLKKEKDLLNEKYENLKKLYNDLVNDFKESQAELEDYQKRFNLLFYTENALKACKELKNYLLDFYLNDKNRIFSTSNLIKLMTEDIKCMEQLRIHKNE